jgi:hypothetical protein
LRRVAQPLFLDPGLFDVQCARSKVRVVLAQVLRQMKHSDETEVGSHGAQSDSIKAREHSRVRNAKDRLVRCSVSMKA